MDQPDNDSHAPSFWRRPAGMALATAAVIAGFICCESTGAMFWVIGPYLLLLACPLMHLMHGHGGHGGHGNHAQTPRRTNNDKE